MCDERVFIVEDGAVRSRAQQRRDHVRVVALPNAKRQQVSRVPPSVERFHVREQAGETTPS